MILGQLRIGARATTYAALVETQAFIETKQAHVRHMFKSICYHKQKIGQEKI